MDIADLDRDSRVFLSMLAAPGSDPFCVYLQHIALPGPPARDDEPYFPRWWAHCGRHVDRAVAAMENMVRRDLAEVVQRLDDGTWRTLSTDDGLRVVAERDRWWLPEDHATPSSKLYEFEIGSTAKSIAQASSGQWPYYGPAWGDDSPE